MTKIDTDRIKSTFPVLNSYDEFETVLTSTYVHEDRPFLDKLIYAVRFHSMPRLPPMITSCPTTSLSDASGLFRFAATMANPSQSPILSDAAFTLGATTHLGNKWLQPSEDGIHYEEDYSKELTGLTYINGDPIPNPIVTYAVADHALIPTKIQVFGTGGAGKTYTPQDASKWYLAKPHVVKSRNIYRTYVTHAVGFHIHVLRIRYAALMHLTQAHPVRRLIDAFTRYGKKAAQERFYPSLGPTGSVTRLVGIDVPSTRLLINNAIRDTPVGSEHGMIKDPASFEYPAQSLVLGLLDATKEYVTTYMSRFYTDNTINSDPSLAAFCTYIQTSANVTYELNGSSVVSLLASLICDVVVHSIVHNQEKLHGADVYRENMNTLQMDGSMTAPVASRVLHAPISPAGLFFTQYIVHLVRYNLDMFGFDLFFYVPFAETPLYLERIEKITAGLSTDYRIQDCASSVGI
jgi:hypothetical protein